MISWTDHHINTDTVVIKVDRSDFCIFVSFLILFFSTFVLDRLCFCTFCTSTFSSFVHLYFNQSSGNGYTHTLTRENQTNALLWIPAYLPSSSTNLPTNPPTNLLTYSLYQPSQIPTNLPTHLPSGSPNRERCKISGSFP